MPCCDIVHLLQDSRQVSAPAEVSIVQHLIQQHSLSHVFDTTQLRIEAAVAANMKAHRLGPLSPSTIPSSILKTDPLCQLLCCNLARLGNNDLQHKIVLLLSHLVSLKDALTGILRKGLPGV